MKTVCGIILSAVAIALVGCGEGEMNGFYDGRDLMALPGHAATTYRPPLPNSPWLPRANPYTFRPERPDLTGRDTQPPMVAREPTVIAPARPVQSPPLEMPLQLAAMWGTRLAFSTALPAQVQPQRVQTDWFSVVRGEWQAPGGESAGMPPLDIDTHFAGLGRDIR
jgi:hypothetical protein